MDWVVNIYQARVRGALSFARTVAYPVQVAYWTLRSWPPADTVSHVNLDQRSGDMAVGFCGLGAILAWQGVSRARLQARSSRKAGVRPLLTEPGPRLRHSLAAVTDHNVYASKAEWFRAQNSAYRSVATSLPSNNLLVARAGNVELDRYPQLMLPGAEIR